MQKIYVDAQQNYWLKLNEVAKKKIVYFFNLLIFFKKNLALIERADSLDVELTGFRTIIDSLSEKIDSVAQEIDRRVEYHSTCDA